MARADLPDGGFLVYDVHDFTQPWRDAVPVVLVHGFSKNRKFWFEWIPALAARYRVVNVDQRGHGDSSPVPADLEMALEPFADDLVTLLDVLGIDAAHFVMAEFSSSVAIALAIRHADRVASLVLPGFGYRWPDPGGRLPAWIEILKAEGSDAWARKTVDDRLPAGADPGLREWYVSEQGRADRNLLIKVFGFSPTLDLTDQLPLVRVPTLILGGTAAKQESSENLRIAADLIPNCELVLFDGMPFNVMSACPADCVRETLKFLDRVDAG